MTMSAGIRHQLVLLAMGLCLAGAAHATSPLDAWRSEAAATRMLAENDAPRAYEEAKRLQAALPGDAAPADRARLLNLLARIETYLALTDEAARHAQAAMDLAKRHGDAVGQVEADLNVALNAVNQAKIDEVVAATAHGMDMLKGVDRPDLLAEAMLRTSMKYRRLGQFDDSVTIAMQTMDIARRTGDRLALTYACQGLAIAYDQSGRKQEARQYFLEMRDHARAAGSRLLEADAMLGLGQLTGGGAGEEQIRTAIALYRSVGAPFAVAHGLYAFADGLRQQGHHAAARPLLDEVAAIYEHFSNKIGLWWALDARSESRQALGQLAAAQADAERAYALAREIGLILYLGESEKHLAALTAARGDYQLAYQLTVKASERLNEATAKKSGERMVELAKRYQAESRQREIDELTRRNERQALRQRWLWTSFGAASLMLLVSGYFLVRQRRSNRLLAVVNTQMERWHDIFEHAEWGVVVGSADGRTLELMNPAFARIHGYTVAELAGRPIVDVCAPQSQEAFPEQIRIAHEQGHHSFESWHLRKDGTVFPVFIDITAVRGANGEVLHRIVNVQDITERKRMEEELAYREHKFRTLAENSPNLIVRYDLNCRRVYVNPAYVRETGIGPDETFNGVPDAQWAASMDIPAREYRAALERVMATGTPAEMFIAWRHPKTGAVNDYAVQMVAEHGSDGTVLGALMLGHNITALKEAERRLEESHAELRGLAARIETVREEERKRIAGDLHDELGQYLTALRMGIAVLRMQAAKHDEAVAEKAGGLSTLVDKTIEVMRDIAASLRPAPLDMGLVSALEWLVTEFTKHTGIPCRLDSREEDIALDDARSTAVFRMVQESLTNVARHAEASRVDIRIVHRDRDYFLEIADDGKGFDPSRTKKKSFGLVGMRERAAMLDGEVSISSAPGHGTTVGIRIPTAVHAATRKS